MKIYECKGISAMRENFECSFVDDFGRNNATESAENCNKKCTKIGTPGTKILVFF